MKTAAVEVRNAQRKVRVDLADLRAFARRALPLCLREKAPARSDLKKLDEVSVVLISDARIARLHLRFMKIAGPTDVITFQHGEIFISVETARRQARQFASALADELKLYLVHGLLHLHGFDDLTARGAREMERVQARIFAQAKQS